MVWFSPTEAVGPGGAVFRHEARSSMSCSSMMNLCRNFVHAPTGVDQSRVKESQHVYHTSKTSPGPCNDQPWSGRCSLLRGHRPVRTRPSRMEEDSWWIKRIAFNHLNPLTEAAFVTRCSCWSGDGCESLGEQPRRRICTAGGRPKPLPSSSHAAMLPRCAHTNQTTQTRLFIFFINA